MCVLCFNIVFSVGRTEHCTRGEGRDREDGGRRRPSLQMITDRAVRGELGGDGEEGRGGGGEGGGEEVVWMSSAMPRTISAPLQKRYLSV